MKIFVICSKHFYYKIPEIKQILENKNHTVELPNCYDCPETEQNMTNLGGDAHKNFKAEMFKKSEQTISNVDAVLVLNFDKNRNDIVYKNYIGGATFLEMYDAFRFNKKIYLLNEVPEGIFSDEIDGFSPIILNGDLNSII